MALPLLVTSTKCISISEYQNSISDQKQLYVDAAEISCCPVFRSTCYRSGGDSQYAQIFIINKKNPAPKLYNSKHLFSMSHALPWGLFGVESKTETDRFIYDIFHIFMVSKSVSNFFEGSSLNLMCGMFGNIHLNRRGRKRDEGVQK